MPPKLNDTALQVHARRTQLDIQKAETNDTALPERSRALQKVHFRHVRLPNNRSLCFYFALYRSSLKNERAEA